MLKSLKGKLIIPVVLLLLVLAVILTITSSVKFSNYNNNLISEQLRMSANSMKDDLVYLRTQAVSAAQAMSMNAAVAEALMNADSKRTAEILGSMIDPFNVSFFAAFNANGEPVAGTAAPADGGPLADAQLVTDALNGQPAVYYGEGSGAKVAVCAGAPIYGAGGIAAGAVVAGIRLDTNDFVDKLKSIYGMESTIFYGDTRVATTIVQEGKRVVGTKLAAANAERNGGHQGVFGQYWKNYESY